MTVLVNDLDLGEVTCFRDLPDQILVHAAGCHGGEVRGQVVNGGRPHEHVSGVSGGLGQMMSLVVYCLFVGDQSTRRTSTSVISMQQREGGQQ